MCAALQRGRATTLHLRRAEQRPVVRGCAACCGRVRNDCRPRVLRQPRHPAAGAASGTLTAIEAQAYFESDLEAVAQCFHRRYSRQLELRLSVTAPVPVPAALQHRDEFGDSAVDSLDSPAAT